MIVFDLDGTLANCEHRRHFVDGSYREGCDHWHQIPGHPLDMCDECKIKWKEWRPNWPAFYEACDKDEPIEPVLSNFIHLTQGEPFNHNVQIWSGRCESVREKTLKWLVGLTGYCEDYQYWDRRLKMRPIGDNTPDDVLKEKWLDSYLLFKRNDPIDFVFDSNPKNIAMWRRRGIFVFNCAQSD
jgi:hypothetical protein